MSAGGVLVRRINLQDSTKFMRRLVGRVWRGSVNAAFQLSSRGTFAFNDFNEKSAPH